MANFSESLNKSFLIATIIFFILTLIVILTGQNTIVGPGVILFFISLSLYFNSHLVLKSFAFTLWVFTFVAVALFYPVAFGTWFGFDLKHLIVPLIQIIMFGMGTTLSLQDFSRVIKMPWPVFLGLILQYSVMPFAGLSLALLFNFEPEIAAGVVLIGSCPGGVASNLMTYLAGGNVALSVTMTSCSTLMSPIMTPFLMKSLAGRFVPIDFIAMMLSILNMIIVPVIAGIIANRILYSKSRWAHQVRPLALISAITLTISFLAFFLNADSMGVFSALKSGTIIGFMLIGIVALSKLIISVLMKGPENWMDKTLPIVSMAGICYIIAIITARSSEKLMTVGVAIVAVGIMHNFIGYILGYWLARAGKLDESSCRTVAFEVGMQNGGMASGLAMTVLNSANTALAPAIFGPWMNISGSTLANWWRRKGTGSPEEDK